MRLVSCCFVLVIGFSFVACGGGSSSDGGSSSGGDKSFTGQFIDAAVEGLEYECSPSGKSGVTNADGEFTCNEGDSVVFSVAGVNLGSASVGSIITPRTLFPGDDAAAVNMAQFLQTLDSDGDPDNGISLDTNSNIYQNFQSNVENARANNTLNIDLVDSEFDTVIAGYLGTNLVDENDAKTHLDETIARLNNHTPSADAGADQSVQTGVVVTLDGSASSDEDGDILAYSWSITSKPMGSSATLSDDAVVSPTFTPDVDGTYELALMVYDGKEWSQSDLVIITANTSNAAPMADAGADQNVVVNTLVTLDGSASSDADGDQLTYSWSISSMPNGSSAVLTNETTVNPTFTPDLEGSYEIALMVNDGTDWSTTDLVTIVVTVSQSVVLPDVSTLEAVFVVQYTNKTVDEYKNLSGVPADSVFVALSGYTTCPDLGFASGGTGGIYTDGSVTCYHYDKQNDAALGGTNHLLYYTLKDTSGGIIPTDVPDLSSVNGGILLYKNMSEDEYQSKVDAQSDTANLANVATSCEEWGFTDGDIKTTSTLIPGLGGTNVRYESATGRVCTEVDYLGTTYYEGNQNLIVY